jgi:hypothetical protein
MGLQVPIVELPYFTSRWTASDAVRTEKVEETPYFLFVGSLENI